MSVYVTIEDLGAEIPAKFLSQALHDSPTDGLTDAQAFAPIAATASADVDALLGDRFVVPFTGLIPALVKRAARIFTLEKLYLRRGLVGPTNPWTKQADELRTTLRTCGKGILVQTQKPSATAITEQAKSVSRFGNLTV